MGGHIFWVFLLLQAVVAVFVVFLLRKKLDQELVEAALEKLEVYRSTQGAASLTVRFAWPLDARAQERLRDIVRRKFNDFDLQVQQDKSLKAGVVFIAGEEVMDFSLASRLRQVWS